MVVDATVDALYATFDRLTSLSPGMFSRVGDTGTRLVFTGLPMDTLNVVAVGRDSRLSEVDAFAVEMAALGAPWSIVTRTEPDADLLDLAARHGRTSSSTLPLLVWDAELLPTLPADVPPGATVRRIAGGDGAVYAEAMAQGFGMPRGIADAFATPEILDAPGSAAFVLEVAGEAVATGYNMLVGDQVGMYNGSVPPAHRGRGYYRALVAARLRHAVAASARHAFTQNTPMSRPLYESFGFQLAEEWTYLTAAS
ncbi:GNAT family N-acetyltransferase [Kutzneria buriramensis]|uniref:Acetyltransferase (GNAT) family protein n=1 Tax=Kutzneria buriramensis TaxID=1045776 RepID=A0A3E0GXF6_9PSEU|nr:GNAT family N-acetyltransferase [Kutzneria buriramensis]REH29590.1 Acetyltransferase (GNAT) family protein [Kutzneria buriramensis]